MTTKINAILSLFLFWICTSNLVAQPEGDLYYAIADSLYEIDEYTPAILNFKKANSYYKKNKAWEKSVKTVSLVVSSYIQIDQYDKAILQEEEVARLATQEVLQESFEMAKVFFRLAYAYEKSGRLVTAFHYYEKAIDIFEATNAEGYYVAYAYRDAAEIALRLLEYPKAIAYLKKGLAQHYSSKLDASICGQLANTFFFLKAFEEQYKYINQGLSLNPGPYTLSILNTNLSDYYLYNKDFKKAERYAFEVLDFYKSDREGWLGRIAMYRTLADIYVAQGSASKAIPYYQKAEREAKGNHVERSRDLAHLYIKIGQFYFEHNNLEEALRYFQKSFFEVFPDFNDPDVLKNPPLTQVYRESWIMDAAAWKAKTLKKKHEISGDTAYLKVAAECYQLVIATVDELRRNYGSEKAKIYLGDYGYNYFEEAIEVQYLLYGITAEQKYQENILSLMERSKAVVLSDAIQRNKAIVEAGIPDSLLRREKELRDLIAEKNIELINNKKYDKEKREKEMNTAEVELHDLRSKYEKHSAFLKQRYSIFQSLTQDFIPPTIPEVQAYLAGTSTLLVEYFVGTQDIYILKIAEEQVSVHQIKNTEKTNQLVETILPYFKSADQFLNAPDIYFNTAYQLYANLFPSFSNQNASYQNIIIIPDGALKQIPFEALVDTAGITGINHSDHYLLHKYLIYYTPSIHLMLTTKSRGINGEYFLNVAPGFAKNERGMIPLISSKEEVESVHKMVSLEGKEAKLGEFKKMVENSNVIHLSTHASVGSSDEIPKIEFIDTALFLPEIYALNLKADLVVLSACESQLGELKKGEGVMSLSRGFFYAGASSLISSLWSVNEQSTAQIFGEFYEQLNNGKPKAEALKMAKQIYVEQTKSDLRKSPYYWAGFVYLGNNERLEMPKANYNLYRICFWILGLSALGAMIFFGIKKIS